MHFVERSVVYTRVLRWLAIQDVVHEKTFLYKKLNVKLRLNDQFMQNWNGRLQDSSRANLYKHIASFNF